MQLKYAQPKSMTLVNMLNKYSTRDPEKLDVMRKNTSPKKQRKVSEVAQDEQLLGEQFRQYIKNQMNKKVKAQALNEQLSSAKQEEDSEALRNVRVQKAVEKIKNKLKIQHRSRDQKFESKFSAFAGLNTFVDVKSFLQNLNGESIKDRSNLISPRELDSPSEILDDHEINGYNDIILRSKEVMFENRSHMDQIKRSIADDSTQELYDIIQLQTSRGQAFQNDDDKNFFTDLDDIIKAGDQQYTISDEKYLELEEIEKRKNSIMNQFRLEIDKAKVHDRKKVNSPQNQQHFMNKSRKILQLLEKTTKNLFKKILQPSDSSPQLNAKEQRIKRQKIQIQSIRQIKESAECIILTDFDKTKPLNTVASLPRIEQSTSDDILLYKSKIESNKMLKRAVSLKKTDIKQFIYDNGDSLHKLQIPKLNKGVGKLFDNNKRGIITSKSEHKTSNSNLPTNRFLPKVSIKEKIDNNAHNFDRYSTSQILIQQRNQFIKLIKRVDQTQKDMQLEAPMFQSQINRFEEELSQGLKKLKTPVLESLSYFSKTERNDQRTLPNRLKQKGMQIF